MVLGVERLHGAAVRCTDRVAVRRCAQRPWPRRGDLHFGHYSHRRGYQSIEDDLAALGADIRRVEETASPDRQTVKENHHGKTERIGAAAQTGKRRLPL